MPGEHGVHRLRGDGHAVLGIDPVGDDRDLGRGHPQQQARFRGGVLGYADDAVRPPHVIADQRHVVALDLRLRHVRVLQEEQVVDGDDLLRAFGRQQQRVGRVREVEGRPDEAIERRPFEAVPRVVERAHREAPVHQLRIRGPGPIRVSVAEGGREQEEPILRRQGGQPLREGQDV
jgi:hypothetical protein